MRELKFRLIRDGKHIQGYEKWVDGVPNKDTGYWATPPQWIYSRDNVLWSNPEIFHDSKDQFTGRKDKNGVEVYEGDIIDQYPGTEWTHIRTVKWNQKRCGYWLYNLNGEPHLDLTSFREELEIIGNVHQDSHLLTNQN
ncbi:hypothetical protein LCGC14_0428280 [marine sediment metagenome]|uniref:YopX protein domain-containing protein n=1 Tax=marine sediment metagenome TaxID=412755 RepID=A0A0F9VY74_9ZZZZ